MSREYKPSPLNKYGIRCFNPPGQAQTLADEGGLSNAIVIPAGTQIVHIVGQLGRHGDLSFPTDVGEEYDLAFQNTIKALEAAGVNNGFEAVTVITFYLVDPLEGEAMEKLGQCFHRYLGKNRPASTGIRVAGLAYGARIEMVSQAVLSTAKL